MLPAQSKQVAAPHPPAHTTCRLGGALPAPGGRHPAARGALHPPGRPHPRLQHGPLLLHHPAGGWWVRGVWAGGVPAMCGDAQHVQLAGRTSLPLCLLPAGLAPPAATPLPCRIPRPAVGAGCIWCGAGHQHRKPDGRQRLLLAGAAGEAGELGRACLRSGLGSRCVGMQGSLCCSHGRRLAAPCSFACPAGPSKALHDGCVRPRRAAPATPCSLPCPIPSRHLPHML